MARPHSTGSRAIGGNPVNREPNAAAVTAHPAHQTASKKGDGRKCRVTDGFTPG